MSKTFKIFSELNGKALTYSEQKCDIILFILNRVSLVSTMKIKEDKGRIWKPVQRRLQSYKNDGGLDHDGISGGSENWSNTDRGKSKKSVEKLELECERKR